MEKRREKQEKKNVQAQLRIYGSIHEYLYLTVFKQRLSPVSFHSDEGALRILAHQAIQPATCTR